TRRGPHGDSCRRLVVVGTATRHYFIDRSWVPAAELVLLVGNDVVLEVSDRLGIEPDRQSRYRATQPPPARNPVSGTSAGSSGSRGACVADPFVPAAASPDVATAGFVRSRKRRSSTGNGRTTVEFFSAATSTTVWRRRSCSAVGVSAILAAACANLCEAASSPSAVMIRARRSRSASACRAIDRFIDSGSATSLISTRSMWIPQPRAGLSIMIFRP